MNRTEKAFDFAAGASKQMIALSTGIIALTVTLLKDVLNDPAARTGALEIAWLAFGISIGCGLWFLLALTGSLSSKKISDAELTINSQNAKKPMWGQLITFLLGLTFTIIFGMTGLRRVVQAPPGSTDTSAAHKTKSEVTKILSIGPFVEADTTLERGDWTVIEREVLDLVNRYRSKAAIDGILVLGGIDQRSLSTTAAIRFGDNQGLANARAEATRSRLQPLVGDSLGVFAIALGALSLGPGTHVAELRQDRHVDLYVITRMALKHAAGR